MLRFTSDKFILTRQTLIDNCPNLPSFAVAWLRSAAATRCAVHYKYNMESNTLAQLGLLSEYKILNTATTLLHLHVQSYSRYNGLSVAIVLLFSI